MRRSEDVLLNLDPIRSEGAFGRSRCSRRQWDVDDAKMAFVRDDECRCGTGFRVCVVANKRRVQLADVRYVHELNRARDEMADPPAGGERDKEAVVTSWPALS